MTEIAEPELSEEERQALQMRLARKLVRKRRSAQRQAFNTARSGEVNSAALQAAMAALNVERSDSNAGAATGPQPLAFPGPVTQANRNKNRWVPIGPSVVLHGQAEGSPRVSGRIRDLQVSPDGKRAYAASAKGGVWYTEDAGSTWEPLGGWAREPRRQGGNAATFSIGCLLVAFREDTGQPDFVMVGTGEIGVGFDPGVRISESELGGVGVLVARSPSSASLEDDPWESETGIQQLEGLAIHRMARVPGTGAAAGEENDQVLAATSSGVYLGERTRTGPGSTLEYQWDLKGWSPTPSAPAASARVAHSNPSGVHFPTDLLFAGNRLYFCFSGLGVAYVDNLSGANITLTWLSLPLASGVPLHSVIDGRMSMALNGDGDTIYVLGQINKNPRGRKAQYVPHVWKITNLQATTTAAINVTALSNVPNEVRMFYGQHNYDQAIMAHTHTPVGGTAADKIDRLYLGGGGVQRKRGGIIRGLHDWNASLWAFEVNGNALRPVTDISRVADGANYPGYIGNGVHADVHVIRKAGTTDHIWVGCDGGVFTSQRNGRWNTFAACNTGLATLEAGYVASHPTSSQYLMLGCQDNGRQVRIGETVWELKTGMEGDGGGVLIHPEHPRFVVGQYTNGAWEGDPGSRFRAPLGSGHKDAETEAGSLFYSGITARTRTTTGSGTRIALGTNRVWITDNLGVAHRNTWKVLPITDQGVYRRARDPRASANRAAGSQQNRRFGVPNLIHRRITKANPVGMLGRVVTVKWQDDLRLLALYEHGVVQYQEHTDQTHHAGEWTSDTLLEPLVILFGSSMLLPKDHFFTDIEPVPGTNSFYLTATGKADDSHGQPVNAQDTCYFYVGDGPYSYKTTGLINKLGSSSAGSGSSGATGSVDPAYSLAVDPADTRIVYVGTYTGVWRGTRNPTDNSHTWEQFDNGLPEFPVQDLNVWQKTGAVPQRLLRATLQSRGVWEVYLAAETEEPVRTYLRVHNFDDRREFPVPLQNPQRNTGAPAATLSAMCSPDITIRPESPVTNTPAYPGTALHNSHLRYQLWTFQTAFRWIYPSVIANGKWTDQLGDLVVHYRHVKHLANPNRRSVDSTVWNAVMAEAQDRSGHPGVYRAPWQNDIVSDLPATEIDMMETILPVRDRRNIWEVYRERSTVDVLLHHRDTLPVPANEAAAVLLWRSALDPASLMAADCSHIVNYARSLFSSGGVAVPAGWRVAAHSGSALHRLALPLAARMPRSVAINLDLSISEPPSGGGAPVPVVPDGHHVLLLALAASSVDPFSANLAGTHGATIPVEDFVRNWPYAAARIIKCRNRPRTQLF